MAEHGDWATVRNPDGSESVRCWETDILPAAVIEQALDRHINIWLDAKKWQQRDREIEQAPALL